MRRRRRAALAVSGVVANLVGIAALALPWLPLTVVTDTTTTMMWVEGFESAWSVWAWVGLAVAGLAIVVAASLSGGSPGIEG